MSTFAKGTSENVRFHLANIDCQTCGPEFSAQIEERDEFHMGPQEMRVVCCGCGEPLYHSVSNIGVTEHDWDDE